MQDFCIYKSYKIIKTKSHRADDTEAEEFHSVAWVVGSKAIDCTAARLAFPTSTAEISFGVKCIPAPFVDISAHVVETE